MTLGPLNMFCSHWPLPLLSPALECPSYKGQPLCGKPLPPGFKLPSRSWGISARPCSLSSGLKAPLVWPELVMLCSTCSREGPFPHQAVTPPGKGCARLTSVSSWAGPCKQWAPNKCWLDEWDMSSQPQLETRFPSAWNEPDQLFNFSGVLSPPPFLQSSPSPVSELQRTRWRPPGG